MGNLVVEGTRIIAIKDLLLREYFLGYLVV
jgi:hypothetical protein